MKYRLKVTTGPAKGRSFDLNDGQTLVIGRGEKSDTRINDPSVSRVHCEVACNANGIEIADRGSSSGTFVGGKQIDRGPLELGSVIRIGDTEIRVDKPVDNETTVIGTVSDQTTLIKPLPQLVGTQLGPYRLDGILGTGNSGMVFKAHDTEKERDAAVKVLSPQFTSNDEQRQRFVRAMKTILPVRSAHIIRLYGAGKSGPYCWAAMELIEGENLAAEIERLGIEGMLDWKKVWQVAVDIGQALQAGFEAKIIHRNVTPTNIIRRASDKTCLLGDFMLAKALEGTLAQQVTQPGQILGDIPYLAPERTRADVEIDTRSDMYGLGATCYALLTGRPPVDGDGMTEIIQNVRNQVPKEPKQFQYSINDLFQDVVMKMLDKDPDRRYQTPTALVKELIRIGNYNNLTPSG